MAAFMIISFCRVCVCVCVYYTYVCVLVAQLCSTLCDPMDCNLPGSSIHGILQARVLEWGAFACIENAEVLFVCLFAF